MSDIRNLLESLDRLDEAQQHDFLDEIVDKYADDEMTIEDLSSMEQEAEDADPPDTGFMSRVRRGFLTKSYKKKYVLAKAADKLGLPGLYDSQGDDFFYLDDDGEAKGAGSASKSDAEAINSKGLLPDNVAEKFDLAGDKDTSQDQDDAPQTDDELDADSADQGSEQQSGSGTKLSDGSSFDAGNERSRTLAAQKAGELLNRYKELLRKMNESAPISIRGYLKEYNLYETFLTEALNDEERAELADIIDDLNTLVDSEGLLSPQNQELFRREITDAPSPQELRGAGTQDDEAPADSGDTGGDEETPPEAQQASDASGDQGADTAPGEGPTAGSLKAFADSGKGGLANDPDEEAAIEELQQYLTDLGFDPNGVDGKYGPGTIKAVKQFQEYTGAKVDGDAGPETIGKIIKLRGIKWGEGGSKSFVDFRNAMSRMEELLQKAEGGDTANESNDMRKYLAIFERILNEELSDTEREELQGLVSDLQSAYDDPEWQQALPDSALERFTNNFDRAKEIVGDTADDEDGDENETQDVATMDDAEKAKAIYDGIDGMGTDEEAVLAVLGSIADEAELDRVKQAFQQLYNEDMMEWIDSEVSFSDQDAVDNMISRITGDSDSPQTVEDIVGASEAADALDDALNGGFFFGLGTEEKAVLEILGRISTRDFPTVMSEFERKTGTNLLTDLESELSGTDKERVNDIIKRFGYEFQDEAPGYKEVGSGGASDEEGGDEDDADGSDTADSENVPARPTGGGRSKAAQRSRWDRQYSQTHNPDGTPKSAGNNQSGAANIAQRPDPATPEDAMEIVAASKDQQQEILAGLTPEEQALYREMLAAQGDN